MGRKANYIYIACEGHTEAAYLKEIKKREKKMGVEIKFCCLNGEQNPKKFIERAYESYIEEVKSFRETNLLKGKVYQDDRVWCVYDVDNKSVCDILELEQLAREKKMYTAQSNPSIELWFLLHFSDVFYYDSYDQDSVETALKGYWTKYHKADETEKTKYLEVIGSRENGAIERSNRLKAAHEEHVSGDTTGPRTGIDDLLRVLKK